MSRLPDGTSSSVLLAEEAVIAAVLLDDEAYALVADLEPGDFWNEEHQKIWGACQWLADREQLVTVITVAHELASRDELKEGLDEVLLQTIVGRWFTSVGIEAHARIVTADAERRRLTRLGAEIVREANRGNLGRAREMIDGGGVSLDYGE
jgi:replicative DNA helicase